MTIGQYSSSIRMSLAENLLCTTELSVEEISKKLGYHHSGNFVKAFKKAHGKTPLALEEQENLRITLFNTIKFITKTKVMLESTTLVFIFSYLLNFINT